MSPSLSNLSQALRRGVIASAIVVACGSTAALADVYTVRSNATSGITALTAFGHAGSSTVDYGSGFGPTWQFGNFAANNTFTAAQGAAAASVLTTNLPGTAWNNNTSADDGWDPSTSVLNNGTDTSRWISNGTDGNPSPVTSVLFAIPFNNTSGHTLANISFSFVTDNGLGSRNGANGTATPTANQNGGLFLNGSEAQVSYNSAPGNSNNPGQFQTIQTLTFSNVTLLTGQNWLYFHQFNWGTYGGSAFAGTITTMVPLPAPVWGGIGGLAGVGCIAAIRRRRMA